MILSRVAPFVGFPSLDLVDASEPNDFRIVDFLLLLESIEAAFHWINVPRFLP